MDSIRVSDGNFSLKLPVKKDRISLQTVKSYFPGASSLTYLDKQEKCGVLLSNDEFELVPGVTEYQIHYADCLKESNHSASRKRRIIELIDEVEGNTNENCKVRNPPSNAVAARKVKNKFVEVVWREKTFTDKGNFYQQMRGTWGGIRKMELDQNKDYSFKEIRELAIQAMRSSKNANTLDNSIIQLATNEEQIINEFTDARGRKCSFWDFSYKIKKTNAQLRLCLLSTPNKSANQGTSKNQHNVGSITSDKTKSKSQKTVFTVTSKQSRVYPQPSKQLNVSTNSADPEKRNDIITSKYFTDVELLEEDSSSQKSAPINDIVDLSGSQSESFNNVHRLELSVPVIEQDELQFSDNILGRGSFGSVILCKWKRNGSHVAVKKIRVTKEKKYLVRELHVMDAVRHPNIISLMAACCTDEYWFIVMEYFKSSTLRHFINNRPENLDFFQQRKEDRDISLQICQAVAYLHELTPCIIHKDIKTDNILINEHLMVKLCDLGLSKTSDIDSSSSLNTTIGHNFRGTPMYMAPEIVVKNCPASKPTDIWATACCLVELFCVRNVWTIKPKFTVSALRELLMNGAKPDLTDVPTVLQGIIEACFDHDPTNRPSALILVKTFECVINNTKKV